MAMETLELYISKVEQAAEAQYSSDSSNMTDPQELEEAILVGTLHLTGCGFPSTNYVCVVATRSQSCGAVLFYGSNSTRAP